MTLNFEPIDEHCCAAPWRVSERRAYTAIGVDPVGRCLTELFYSEDGGLRQTEIEGTRVRCSNVLGTYEDFAYELAWDLVDDPVPDNDSVRPVRWVPALLIWARDGRACVVGADPHPLTGDLFAVLEFLGKHEIVIGRLASIPV